MKRTKHNGLHHPIDDKGDDKLVGRPPVYNDTIPDRTYRLCLLGLTDPELATAFGVNRSTINNWKDEHPAFLDALSRGKDEADGNVAERLYRRATGYEHADTKAQWVPAHIDSATKEYVKGKWHTLELTRHYAPDTGACKMWLTNRRKQNWAETLNHAGADGGPLELIHRLDLSKLTDAELELAAKLGFNKLTEELSVKVGLKDASSD